MKIADLFESIDVSAVDRQMIIDHMISRYLKNGHWDDHALKTRPDLTGFALYDMANSWRDFGHLKHLSHLSDEELFQHQDFISLLTKWADGRYDEIIERLQKIPLERGQYVIHRVIKVPSDFWLKQRISLGLYWTYNLYEWQGTVGAYPIWGTDNPGNEYMIEATVAPASVDWPVTIMANMDWMSGDQEYEMRLLAGKPVNVQHVWEGDEMHGDRLGPGIDISGKMFTA